MNEIFLKGNNNQLEETKKLEYNDLVERFLNYIDVSENTIQTYKYSLKQWALYLYENNINIPTRQDVLNYKELLMKKHSANTTNLYLVSLKNFYRWLEYECGFKNITENIKSMKMERKHLRRALTEEEVSKIMDNCKDIREKLLMSLALTCALRSNEVVNIQLKDFYNDNGVIMLNVLGKGRTSKVDSVKVDSRVFDLLQQYVEQYNITDYLFTSTSNHSNGNNKPVQTITIRRIFNAICERAGIDRDRCSFHSCRHFSATKAIKNGMDLLEVSEMLRHQNVSTTQVYIDEIKKSESKFANMLGDVVFNGEI